MSSTSGDGEWVWNVLPKDAGAPFKLAGGQLEVDSNGVHLRQGPGHCGGLIASFPLGTLVWREDSPPSPKNTSAPAVELVAGELAQFDLSPRVEIGAVNITCSAGVDLAALIVDLREMVSKAYAAR